MQNFQKPNPHAPNRTRLALGVMAPVAVVALMTIALLWFASRRDSAAPDDGVLLRPAIHMVPDAVRPALPYRIVSFHRGRADKRLIRLAHDLGFNGVQIQIEGSTIDGIKDFAQRDVQEHIVDFCHQLGMKVTIWVHEFSDLPPPWMPESLGALTADNKALWSLLDSRYDWVLRDAVPNIDGLVLTVVETQVRATDPAVMIKLVDLLRRKTHAYHKSLVVRTFVWYPDELANVMSTIAKLPADQIVMTKCVPQDWQMRGIPASEIGNVGGRPQIVEYDVAGEYFLRDGVANCMPELLKKQFDYGVSKGVSGICVRVDRDDSSVLNEPSEVNLWTLGMLASGAGNNLDTIWNAWAVNRYGKAAADGVIRALKPTQEVVTEMLCLGPFTFGDTRYFPILADEDVLGDPWQNWWWDKKYVPQLIAAEAGDAGFTREVQAAKVHARDLADLCLANLELVKEKLTPEDYAILKTKLTTNKVQLDFRAPMMMAYLHYRALIGATDPKERENLDHAMRDDLAKVRAAAAPQYQPAQELSYLGSIWQVGPPEGVQRDAIYHWAYQMDQLRQGINPRPTRDVKRWRMR